MQRVVEKVFFALLRFEINGTQLCDIKNSITPELLPHLFKLSKSHDLAHLIGDALDKNGLLEEGSKARQYFLQERNMAISRYEQQQYEFDRICKVLEDEKIAYIPLKGSVIRNLYPQPWMRTSCDIDILVKESDLNSAICALKQQLNYVANDKKEYHDISLFAPSGVHLELHYSLCENLKIIDKILSCVWDYTIPNDVNSEKKLLNDFFIFHIVVHMLYHFQHGGCGVRPLLDLWLLKNNYSCEELLGEMIKKCGIETFYQSMLELSQCWFSDRQLDEKTALVQDYLLKAGVYGTKKNNEISNTVKSGGKIKRVISYIFLPYENMVILYPVLKKAKILLPIFHVWRWITRVFRVKKAVNYTKEISKQEQKDIKQIKDLFEMLKIN